MELQVDVQKLAGLSDHEFRRYVINHPPQAFLTWMFEVPVTHLSGFLYTRQEIAVNGYEMSEPEVDDVLDPNAHASNDFGAPRGTTVLAPHSGWMIATFSEVPMNRSISYQAALDANPQEQDIQPHRGSMTAKQAQYGGCGLIAQITEPTSRWTSQLCHLDRLLVKAPFECTVTATGVSPTTKLRMHLHELNEHNALWVEAGQPIATSGISGCGWGRPSYSYVTFSATKAPNFTNVALSRWSNPHVHHMFGLRHQVSRTMAPLDTLGHYGTRDDYNFERRLQRGRKHHSLWVN